MGITSSACHGPGRLHRRRRQLRWPELFAKVLTGVVVMSVFVVLVNRLFWRRLYRLAETRYPL